MSAADFYFEESAPHRFEQTQSQALAALRREREGFFVVLGQEDPFVGFSVTGTAEELVMFLETVIASAQDKLERVWAALEE